MSTITLSLIIIGIVAYILLGIMYVWVMKPENRGTIYQAAIYVFVWPALLFMGIW